MSSEPDRQVDAFAVDVRELLGRSVANLYSHLVTRPTGRAVRLAIESQLGEVEGPALSVVDFSSVAVLDYSCADEVVAKLLLRPGDGTEAFFVFRGVREHHREPIEFVLDRHALAAVAETERRRFELLGAGTETEHRLWRIVEARGRVPATGIREIASADEERAGLEGLVRRRLVFRHPARGDIHALSTLIGSSA